MITIELADFFTIVIVMWFDRLVSKQFTVSTFLAVYILSFLMHSFLYVGWWNVWAKEWKDNTNLVVLLVDKELYANTQISAKIQSYAQYVQSKISQSKAIITPIDKNTFKSWDIVKLLENIYFDGEQGKGSTLQWVVLIGDLPLPVVNKNGYIYPSIYPYVDFVNHKFIYNKKTTFFDFNDVDSAQAEIWHGVINLWKDISAYDKYFTKLESYKANPSTFVTKRIWHDDFVALKKSFSPDLLNAYINNFLFLEDIQYRRLSNLIVDFFNADHTKSLASAFDTFSGSTDTTSASVYGEALDAYQQDLAERNEQSKQTQNTSTATTPTLFLKKSIEGFLKPYQEIFSTTYLAKMRDNILAWGRYILGEIDSHYYKVVANDQLIKPDSANSQTLLLSLNTLMEQGLDSQVEKNQWSMNIPIPTMYQSYTNKIASSFNYRVGCTKDWYNLEGKYEPYFFGKNASDIVSAQDFSIYRGTYRNISDITSPEFQNYQVSSNIVDDITLDPLARSVGASYAIADRQIVANRGYNPLNAQPDMKTWENYKKKCDPDKESSEVSMSDYVYSFRWGNTPLNLTQGANNSLALKYSDTSYARNPSYDKGIGGRLFDPAAAKMTEEKVDNTSSYKGYEDFFTAWRIKKQDKVKKASWLLAIFKLIFWWEPSSPHKFSKYCSPADRGDPLKDQDLNFFTIFPRQLSEGDYMNFKLRDVNLQNLKEFTKDIKCDKKSYGIPLIATFDLGGKYKNKKFYEYKTVDSRVKNTAPTPSQINAMNVTTMDRPIDSVRNITFQGLGGEEIKLVYPNLFNVPISTVSDNVATLKTSDQIEQSLRTYLTDKVLQYNKILQAQLSKKTSFYNTNTQAFNFLAQSDSKATPNRSYALLPSDYFITLIGDENIKIAAYHLWYANIHRPTRAVSSNVSQDLKNIKDSFDLNNKISRITSSYLQRGIDNWLTPNQKQLMFPAYISGGYEVAYINSDGFDTIGSETLPSSLSSFDDAKSAFESNQRQEKLASEQPSEYQQQLNNQCNFPYDGAVDIAKWPAALKCWLTETLKSPAKLTFNYANSQWPVWWIGQSFSESQFGQEAKQTLDMTTNQRDQFSKQSSKLSQTSQTLSTQKGVIQAQNTNLLARMNPDQQSSMQTIMESIQLQFAETRGGDPIENPGGVYFIQQDPEYIQQKLLSIGATQNFGTISMSITSTGDNCIQVDGKNTCDSPYIINTINPFQDSKLFEIKPVTTKAGSSNIIITYCVATDICLSEALQMDILPGAIQKFEFATPVKKVIKNSQLPLVVKAYDVYDNEVSTSIENFSLTTDKGLIGQGIPQTSGFDLNQFWTIPIAFVSPQIGLHTLSIKVSPQFAWLSSAAGSNTIQVVDALVDVKKDGNTLSSINYTLPEKTSDIITTNAQWGIRYNTNGLMTMKVKVLEKWNNISLDTPLRVSSLKGGVKVGMIRNTFQDKIVNKKNIKVDTQVFSEQSDFYSTSQGLDIVLYPTFQAGNDIIRIEVPGLDSLDIPVTIAPASAKKLVLTLDTTTTNLWQKISGKIAVQDIWWNPIITPTLIKLWSYGGVKFDNGNKTLTLTTANGWWSFSVITTGQAGRAYVFAQIDGIALNLQQPDYKLLTVQQSTIPQENLNIMYFNLFGTDRGNMWWYFSDKFWIVQKMINTSEKLLAVTTQLIDPSKIKKALVIISDTLQITNPENKKIQLWVSAWWVKVLIDKIATIPLWWLNTFSLQELTNLTSIDAFLFQDKPQIFYIKEWLDSVVTSHVVQNWKVIINNTLGIDFVGGSSASDISIELSSEYYKQYNLWEVKKNGKKIATLVILQSSKNISISSNVSNIALIDPKITPGKWFAQWSTNGLQWVLLMQDSTSLADDDQSYNSIQHSKDTDLSNGFTDPFKNISSFAAGQFVGQATKPFGSEFLINIGDPLLTRITENKTLTYADDNKSTQSVPYDGGLWTPLFADPGKTIFTVKDIDFNNDLKKDFLVVYTDGTIKLLKNYNNTYVDLGYLMTIADGIQDVFIGDIDGDGWSDIIIRTTSNMLKVYKNTNGVFDVDGTPVCLDIPGGPQSVEELYQIFVQDMDKDGKVDIVTNDSLWDIKIFYGGKTNGGYHLLSSSLTSCDADRKSRQASVTNIVKSFALSVDGNQKILDNSLVHWKGLVKPVDPVPVASDNVPKPTPSQLSANEKNLLPNVEILKNLKKSDGSPDMGAIVNSVMGGVQNFSPSQATQEKSSDSLRYLTNPLPYIPVYENLEEVDYIPLVYQSSTDPLEITKTYTDTNGGRLVKGDMVTITVRFKARKNVQFTYVEQLLGPWQIPKTENNTLSGLDISGLGNAVELIENIGDTYQFVVDNIFLAPGQEKTLSYQVRFNSIQVFKIAIEDLNKDTLQDIKIYPLDGCKQAYETLINNRSNSNRAYDNGYIDLGAKINQYKENSENFAKEAMDGTMSQINQQLSSGSPDLSKIPGISDSTEKRNPTSLVNDLTKDFQTNNGRISANININLFQKQGNDLAEKLDTAAKSLCNGFSLGGKGSCKGLPIPFNNAFLAPGPMNIMGCPVFQFQWLPVFHFPGTLPTPVGPIPFPWWLSMVPSDTFYWAGGGVYPSMIRIYVAPTTTLGLWGAICLGPMSVANVIPPPFRDIGGNCITFAGMLGNACQAAQNEGQGDNPAENIEDYWWDLWEMGACTQPPAVTFKQWQSTLALPSSPFSLSQPSPQNFGGNQASRRIQGGTYLGWIIRFDQAPTSFSTTLAPRELAQINLKPWEKINLRIAKGDAKGIIKCIVQDWVDNQVRYVINNLTTISFSIAFPNLQELGKGFDKINLDWLIKAYQNAQANSNATNVAVNTGNILPQQSQLNDISKSIGNPFDAISLMFQETNLININTRDINIQVPLIYQEDINKYKAYLKSRLAINEQILKDWLKFFADLIGLCGNVFDSVEDVTDAWDDIIAWSQFYTKFKQKFDNAKTDIWAQTKLMGQYAKLLKLKSELIQLEKQKSVKSSSNTIDYDILITQQNKFIKAQENIIKAAKDWANQKKLDNTLWGLIKQLDKRKNNPNQTKPNVLAKQLTLNTQLIELYTLWLNQAKINKDTVAQQEFTQTIATRKEDIKELNTKVSQLSVADQQKVKKKLEKYQQQQMCAQLFWGFWIKFSFDNFLKIGENSGQLIKKVRENLKVLDQYKKFPLELYEWIHVTDRYLTEISDIAQSFISQILWWLDTNARRFEQYVDAIITLIGVMKTRQAIIDLSVNRQSACGKCKQDGYDIYSCVLSFMCPSLPVLPIPSFKIPSIFLDFSRIDASMELLLPKFNFVPTQIPLRRLPNLPQPPSFKVNFDMDEQLKMLLDALLNKALWLNLALNFKITDIPILPSPPRLPQLPSFIPSVQLQLPTLPPAPKIPRLAPDIQATLKTVEYVGKIFCLLKWWIWLVGEAGVTSKIEQLTQRTWDVPYFDDFLSTSITPPLKGMDYRIDSFVNFKFNFDPVYQQLATLADQANSWTNNNFKSPIEKAVSTINDASREVENASQNFVNEQIKNLEGEIRSRLNTIQWNNNASQNEISSSNNTLLLNTNSLENLYNVTSGIVFVCQGTMPFRENSYVNPATGSEQFYTKNSDAACGYVCAPGWTGQLCNGIIQSPKTFDNILEFTGAYLNSGQDIYAALQDLKKSLFTLQASPQATPPIVKQVKSIITFLDTPSEVKWNGSEIAGISQAVTSVIEKKIQENKKIADQVNSDYDGFLRKISRTTLVSNNTPSTLEFKASLFKGNKEITDTIASMPRPEKVYMDLNHKVLQGFEHSITTKTPAQLNMNTTTHAKLKSEIINLSDRVQIASNSLEKSPEKVLLAKNNVGGSLVSSSTTSPSTSTPDASNDFTQYINGVFIKSEKDNKLINTVNSQVNIPQFKDRYYEIDVNNDSQKDILLYDQNTVYLKLAGTPKITDTSTTVYATPIFNSPSDIKDSANTDGYIQIRDLKLKVFDINYEVKNFKLQGQNFENIAFSWSNALFSNDDVQWYIVQLSKRVDTMKEDRSNSDISSLGVPKVLRNQYVLVLPVSNQSYTGMLIDIKKSDLRKRRIADLMTGQILDIVYYNPSDETISVWLKDLDRNRYYARVASLIKLPEWGNILFQSASPWSHQEVAGTQILGDGQPPVPEITLIRKKTSKEVSRGLNLNWLINTTYDIKAVWTDNVQVSGAWIQYSWNTLMSVKEDTITLPDQFFTGTTKKQFTFFAVDTAGNEAQEKVSLTIGVPDIDIIDIGFVGSDFANIVAQLSEDIDQGSVKFESQRNSRWKDLSWKVSWISQSLFGVTTDQTISTGGLFEMSKNIALYDTAEQKIWTIDGKIGKITLAPTVQWSIRMNLSTKTGAPVIDLFDTRSASTIFKVYLPGKQLVKDVGIQMKQGIYSKELLNNAYAGIFNGGRCIKKSTPDCLMYVSSSGDMYIPELYRNNFEGTYQRNDDAQTVTYLFTDTQKTPVFSVEFTPWSLVK